MECEICSSNKMLVDLYSSAFMHAEHLRKILKAMHGIEFTDRNEAMRRRMFCKECLKKALEWHEIKKKKRLAMLKACNRKYDGDDDDVQFVSIEFDLTKDKVPIPVETTEEDTLYYDIDEERCSATIKRLKLAFPKLKLPVLFDQKLNISPFVKVHSKLAQAHIDKLHRIARRKVRRGSLSSNIALDQQTSRLDIPDVLPGNANDLKRLLTSSLELQPNEEQTETVNSLDDTISDKELTEANSKSTCEKDQSQPLPQDCHANIDRNCTNHVSDYTLMTPTTTEVIFSCRFCEKTLQTKKGIRKHELRMHSSCFRCNMRFKTFTDFNRHIALHKKEDAMPVAYVRIERMKEMNAFQASNIDNKDDNVTTNKVSESDNEPGLASSPVDEPPDSSSLVTDDMDECNLSPYLQFTVDDIVDEPVESFLESCVMDSSAASFKEEARFVMTIINDKTEVPQEKIMIDVQTNTAKPLRIKTKGIAICVQNMLTQHFDKVSLVQRNAKHLTATLGSHLPLPQKFFRLPFNASQVISENNYKSIFGQCSLPTVQRNRSGIETSTSLPKPQVSCSSTQQTTIISQANTHDTRLDPTRQEQRISNERRPSVIQQGNPIDLTSKRRYSSDTRDPRTRNIHSFTPQLQHQIPTAPRTTIYPQHTAHAYQNNVQIDRHPYGVQDTIPQRKPPPQVVHVAPMVGHGGDHILQRQLPNSNPLPQVCQTTYITPYVPNYPQMYSYTQNNPQIVTNMPIFAPVLPEPKNVLLENDANILPAPVIQFNYMNWPNNAQVQTQPTIHNQNFVPNMQTANAPSFGVAPSMDITQLFNKQESTDMQYISIPHRRREVLRVKTTGELNNYTGSF